MNRARRSLLVLALLSAPLAGCMTWQPAEAGPESLLQQPTPPDRVRVTRTDGVQLVLEAPRLRAGAVVATASPGAVLVENIRLLEVERLDVMRTVLLTIPAPVILFVVGKKAAR